MLRKKQVVAMMSIAVVSFLVGTMFNVTVARKDGGNPIDEIWQNIFDLQDRVETLEEQSIPQGFVTAPVYDSKWLNIEPAETLTLRHNLNTTEVFVYLIGKSDLHDIHQTNYGCNEVEGQGWRGITWYGLNATCIKTMRCLYDTSAQVQWNYVRVMIWKIQEPPT